MDAIPGGRFLDFGGKFLNADGTLNEGLFKDSLHPNRAGYEIWADAVLPVLSGWIAGE